MTSAPCRLKTQYGAVIFIATSLRCDRQSYSGEPRCILCVSKATDLPFLFKDHVFLLTDFTVCCIELSNI